MNAAFRGVPFFADQVSAPFGRRGTVDEYPFSENPPTISDLGKLTRVHTVTGFVQGQDWRTQIRKLRDAVETRGLARLEHPVWGVLLVGNATIDITETLAERWIARFSITCTEAKELANPTSALTDAAGTLTSAIDNARLGVIADFFDRLASATAPLALIAGLAAISDFTKSAVSSLSLPGSLDDMSGEYTEAVDVLAKTSEVSNPQASVTAFWAVLDLAPLSVLWRLWSRFGGGEQRPARQVTGNPTTDQISSVRRTVMDFYPRSAAVALAASVVGNTYATVDAATIDYERAILALQRETEQTETPANVLMQLDAIRVALAARLREYAQRLPNTRTVELDAPTLAFLVSFREFGTTDYENEINGANGAAGLLSGTVKVIDHA